MICPEHTSDLEEAVVHGVLHLAGHDHETDNGEMLALQDDVIERLRGVTRSGFIAVAGRPNVGKSTLVNGARGREGRRHLGQAADDAPRDPRHRATACARASAYQLVLVDLPGVQSPRDELTERMQRRVERELADCDAALFVINAARAQRRRRPLHRAGAGRREAAGGRGGEQGGPRRPRQDRRGARRLPRSWSRRGVDVREIVPVSALKGSGVETLQTALAALLPEGPLYFPREDVSDQPLNVRLAELVREAALKLTREEVPHSIEVHVEDVIAARRRPHGRARRAVGRERVAEGDPDRARRQHGALDRHVGAQGDRARARRAARIWT